ncbi:MAG: carboxypeptidase regulatory-like domain-containing protein, partial [Holophagales bacterium]|nr:carboxypeptidase regulatory-like domain-containing protein [Holophagales bacterium]
MSRRTVSTFGVILCLLVGGAAFGQSATGNLYGTVTDESGAPLPGVSVTVSGIGADRTQFTDPAGGFRFLGLDPGGYTVIAELDGFGGIEYPDVVIRLGQNTDVPLTLTAALEETITVTSESPLLDERQISAGTNVSQVELEKIPTARDPWAVLSQTPG